MMSNLPSVGSSGRTSTTADDNDEDQEMTKVALASFQAREEEIERKKMEVKGKVESQLSRAEEETRRLVRVWEVKLQENCFVNISRFGRLILSIYYYYYFQIYFYSL